MKIVVLKISGKALNEFTENTKYLNLIHKLKKQYDGIIIVHGAGKMISEWSSALNITTSFVDGQRITTRKIMDVVSAVQSGLINSKIISYLQANGFEAAGYTGIDRGLFIADYLNEKLGYVGKPKLTGDVNWLIEMMKSGVLPIYSSVCRDNKGNLMNVNADVFTKEIAIALNAETVLFVSDVEAVSINGLQQQNLTEHKIKLGIKNGEITDGMIPKLNSCVELLQSGIEKVWIGNNPIDLKITNPYSDVWKGTWIVKAS